MKFSRKNIKNWRFWKTQFFWVGHFEFFFSKKNLMVSLVSRKFLAMRNITLYSVYLIITVTYYPSKQNILQELSMVKNLSCVSCAAWNIFPINSLLSLIKYSTPVHCTVPCTYLQATPTLLLNRFPEGSSPIFHFLVEIKNNPLVKGPGHWTVLPVCTKTLFLLPEHNLTFYNMYLYYYTHNFGNTRSITTLFPFSLKIFFNVACIKIWHVQGRWNVTNLGGDKLIWSK